MRAPAWLLLAAFLAGPLAVASEPVAERQIERARSMLDDAEAALREAQDKDDRLAALSLAVSAHESALAALRAGLRALAEEDQRLTGSFTAEHARLTAILGALQAVARAPRSALLAYPSGPLNAARAAAMMGEITPALAREMAALERKLDALRAVRASQEVARIEATGALAALQALRAESARALRRRQEPTGVAELKLQAKHARRRAEDLAGLSAALRSTLPDGAEPGRFADLKGRLTRPVTGRVSGGFGGVDPWGRTGQGVTFEAPSYAQVVAPASGTVRYAGQLIDYGDVVVLEPEEGWLIVLAGLARVNRSVGEAVLAGEPLGDLGGRLPSSEEFLLEAGGETGEIEREKLYMELRRQGDAVDPAPWLDHRWQ